MKTKRWKDVVAKRKISPEKRALLDAQIAQDIMGMTLAELRKESGLTQEETAARTGEMTQSEISKLERRDDHLLSTLRMYVEALGGELQVVAVFGDKTIRLRGV